MLAAAPAEEMCTLGEFYRRLCNRYSDRTALKTPEQSFTYAALEEKSAKLATAFRSMGLGSGDRIAVLMQNRPEFLITEIAASRAGVVVLPLNHKLAESNIEYILDDADIRTIVVGPQFFDTAAELRQGASPLEHIIGVNRNHEMPIGFYDYSELIQKADPTPPDVHIGPEDPAFLYYTGGTTGEQKGTIHPHRAIILNIYAHIHELEVYRNEEMLLIPPLAHSASLFYKTGLTQGSTIHLRQQFSSVSISATLEREDISWTYLIPTMISSLVNADDLADSDTTSLKTVVYGSASIPPSQLQQGIELLGNVFIQFYGLVEVPNLATVLPRQYHDPDNEDWLRSAGVATQLADITILDPRHDHLRDGEQVGEIGIRAPYQMQEYLHDSHRTDGDWIRTGDVGRIDERGRLFVLDRIQDIIVTEDGVVYSSEAENVIQRHSDIEQVAVIGVPATEDYIPDVTPANRLRIDQNVKAVIVTTDSEQISLGQIQAHCRDSLPEYKIPDSIDTVGLLPETAYGKTDKRSLRKPYW
jgi:fatty-acyl-CoA synthase/long-chain acyl-CoA synthetase